MGASGLGPLRLLGSLWRHTSLSGEVLLSGSDWTLYLVEEERWSAGARNICAEADAGWYDSGVWSKHFSFPFVVSCKQLLYILLQDAWKPECSTVRQWFGKHVPAATNRRSNRRTDRDGDLYSVRLQVINGEFSSVKFIRVQSFNSRVEAGSTTSTVALRVVGGEEK
jgi:hypothetical protein